MPESASGRRAQRSRRGRHVASRRSQFPVTAVAIASMVMSVSVIASVSISVLSRAPHAPEAEVSNDITVAVSPEYTGPPRVTGALSVAEAPVTGGTNVTARGQAMAQVASVTVGGEQAVIIANNNDQLTFKVPRVPETQVGQVPVHFLNATGQLVDVHVDAPPVAAAAEGAEPPSALAAGSPAATDTSDPSASSNASATTQPTPGASTPSSTPAGTPTAPLTLTYVPDPRVAAELQYVEKYWKNYNPAYPKNPGNDCANFVSQALIVRGFQTDTTWNYSNRTWSPAWISSTKLREYLLSRPDLATPLSDNQRNRVQVGDVIQLDRRNAEDPDHSGIVTRVERAGSRTRIWYASHTDDLFDRDVDASLRNGLSAQYFSIVSPAS